MPQFERRLNYNGIDGCHAKALLDRNAFKYQNQEYQACVSDNYAHPMYEGGVQLVDMVCL